MKIIFITRTKAQNKIELDKQSSLKDLVKEISSCGITDIYIIVNYKDPNCIFNDIPVTIVQDDNPTSPTSINTILDKIKNNKEKPNAFLVCSKEIELKKEHIKKLIKELKNNQKTLLVVGYKFKIENEKLDNELQGYYANKNLIAYQVPWNTCAIWSYELFNNYSAKFDEITTRNPFNPIAISLDGICSQTAHQGMEDGLAIAKTVSLSREKIKFKLLEEPLNWTINNSEDEIRRTRQKLARKEIVLRNFMAIRNYSVDNLKKAALNSRI